MHVALVTPAWRRFAVTRLALAQRAHLRDELAARGITLTCLVVADDENLDIAAEFGFDTLERPNQPLGRKINDGFELDDADYVAFIGSDNWLHADIFTPLIATHHSLPIILAGHEISVVDLLTARMRHLGWRHKNGVPPWLLPRSVLEQVGFRPCEDERNRGIEGSILRRLPEAEWWMVDPHTMSRVDFKSEVGITAYESVSGSLGVGAEITDPWSELGRHYPTALVDLARETSDQLSREAIAA